MTKTPDHATSTTTAVHASGASYRRLDHWSRMGYLHPSQARQGSGVWRDWPSSELEIARLMVRLIRAGFEVSAAARIARGVIEQHVRALTVPLGEDLVLEIGGLS